MAFRRDGGCRTAKYDYAKNWNGMERPVKEGENTLQRPIANQYREGKVKRTLNKGVKKTLKPCAYKRSERRDAVTACLLHNDPTSYCYRQG